MFFLQRKIFAHCYKIYKFNLYSTSQIFVKPPKIKQMLNEKQLKNDVHLLHSKAPERTKNNLYFLKTFNLRRETKFTLQGVNKVSCFVGNLAKFYRKC